MTPRAFPDLQLNYLERMMEKSRRTNEAVGDDLKLKYLALMCQLRPDMVVLALKTYTFHLEDSLKICEKYKNLHGQAHIKSRTRNIDSAIKIYMQIMKQSIDKYLDTNKESALASPGSGRKSTSMSQSLSTNLSDILFAYQSIVEICKSEVEEMHSDGAAYFNKFMTFVFDLYAGLDKQETVMSKHAEDVYFRYSELKEFVKIEIFDDFLITYISRVGTAGLIEVGFANARRSNIKTTSRSSRTSGKSCSRSVTRRRSSTPSPVH